MQLGRSGQNILGNCLKLLSPKEISSFSWKPQQAFYLTAWDPLRLSEIVSLKSTNYGLWSRLQNTSTATLTICCSGGSVAKSCVTLGTPMNCSTPGFPVLHPPAGLAQTHVHQVCDAIQPSHPLLSPFPPAFNFPQHQGLFPWVSSSHQVVKVVELHLQHRCFQWIFSVLS